MLTDMVVKTDAISGMKELLSQNQELIEPSLTALLNRCAALIADEACLIPRLSRTIS